MYGALRKTSLSCVGGLAVHLHTVCGGRIAVHLRTVWGGGIAVHLRTVISCVGLMPVNELTAECYYGNTLQTHVRYSQVQRRDWRPSISGHAR